MKNPSYLLLSMFVIAACTQTHKPVKVTLGALTISDATPRPGEKITISYQADSTKLAGQKNIENVLYYAVEKRIYALAVPITDSTGTWHGSFTLPDSARAFALKYATDEKTDNNKGRGYIFTVYNTHNKPLAGALAAESNFYGYMGSYLLGIKHNFDTALALLQKDISANPSIKKDWQGGYLTVLLNAKKKDAYPEVEKAIKEMLSGANIKETVYNTAHKLYSLMKITSSADSLKKIILKKYPQGTLAQNEDANAFWKITDVDSMVMAYNKFRQNYPVNKPTSNTANMESEMLSNIASTYAMKQQFAQFKRYASQIKDTGVLTDTYNNIAMSLGDSNRALSLADSIVRVAIQMAQQQVQHPADSKPGYYTIGDWEKIKQTGYGNDIDTYAFILGKEGKYEDALKYEKQAFALTKGYTSDIDERYAEYLVKTGNYDTAKAVIAKLVIEGKATQKMEGYLKTAYTKIKGSGAGFKDYMARLETKADAKLKARLVKELIDKPAPGFTLPDLNGTKVSLASLKGKVVVLDFWATWCYWCKKSFPGMQNSVTHFKNDTNVVFLFVDTWEQGTKQLRYKNVAGFIAQHKYPFHVLMDQPEEKDSTQFETVSAYKIDGIPTKFIIGPNGHIRFKLVGFPGTTEAETKEIAMMINMAKG